MVEAAGVAPACLANQASILLLNDASMKWSHREDLNLQPRLYESLARPIELRWRKNGAGDRGRTRDIQFTKLALCQLSYTGELAKGEGLEPSFTPSKGAVLPLNDPSAKLAEM